MNFLNSKIQNLEIEKTDSRKLIAESEQSIAEKDAEIVRLRVLDERLRKIVTIKYYENLVSPERIAGLSNQITLGDFLGSLSGCLEIRYNFSEENMNLANLTIWQALYLLFGDLDQPQQAPAGPPFGKVADPENVFFDSSKKFLNRLSSQE